MTRIGGPAKSSRLQATITRLQKRAETTTPKTTDADQFGRADAKKSAAKRLGQDPSSVPFIGGPGGGPANHGVLNVRLNALGAKDLGRTHVGDVVIERLDDLKRLSGVTRIEGNLALSELVLGADQSLPTLTLREVSGQVALEGSLGVAALELLSTVKTIGHALYIGFNRDLETLSLPALESVGRGLIVEGNGALATIAFPRLTNLDGYLHIEDNPALKALHLPVLSMPAGEVVVEGNPSLIASDTAFPIGAH